MSCKIKYVSMAGADDSVKPEQLVEISKKFPFVEWGILLSPFRVGTPRYPSIRWLKELVEVQKENNMNLSGHVCGKWCREIIFNNNFIVMENFTELWNLFQRIQLNFSCYNVNLNLIESIKQFNKQFIFQIGRKNFDNLIEHAIQQNINFACLFDCSGGKGILPTKWNPPKEKVFCGYAGGLGPDTIVKAMKEIAKVAKNNEIWIDMESKIRSEDDAFFDLNKIQDCLNLAKEFMENPENQEITANTGFLERLDQSLQRKPFC